MLAYALGPLGLIACRPYTRSDSLHNSKIRLSNLPRRDRSGLRVSFLHTHTDLQARSGDGTFCSFLADASLDSLAVSDRVDHVVFRSFVLFCFCACVSFLAAGQLSSVSHGPPPQKQAKRRRVRVVGPMRALILFGLAALTAQHHMLEARNTFKTRATIEADFAEPGTGMYCLGGDE